MKASKSNVNELKSDPLRLTNTPQSLSLLRAINGVTQGGQWLEPGFSPAAANVRYVKINTTTSPSWVAWTEIEVYGTP